MSRRYSISDSLPSQSRLLAITRLGRTRREVEEALELDADRRDVVLDRRDVEQVPLRRPARRVPDHPRPAADERDRPAAVTLEPDQPEDRDEVPDVERFARSGRSRCTPRSGAPSRAARAARASSRAGSPAIRGPRAARRARTPRPRPTSVITPASQRRDAGTVHGPARSARSGIHPLHGIFTAEMQTSLRRQRRRRLSDRRRPRGNGSTAVKAAAVAIPLFLFTILVLLGVAGATASVAAYSFLSRDLDGPASRRSTTSGSRSRRPSSTGAARSSSRGSATTAARS